MRHLLTGFEFSQEDYWDIINTAIDMKKDPKKYDRVLAGRSGAIMFEKPSLRTRTTFELASTDLAVTVFILTFRTVSLEREKPLQIIHVIYAAG